MLRYVNEIDCVCLAVPVHEKCSHESAHIDQTCTQGSLLLSVATRPSWRKFIPSLSRLHHLVDFLCTVDPPPVGLVVILSMATIVPKYCGFVATTVEAGHGITCLMLYMPKMWRCTRAGILSCPSPRNTGRLPEGTSGWHCPIENFIVPLP